ncbi:putative DsbA family dithiol-disulfide isomerase [Bacilli bacterium PM5-9]|nr:putative DsbA family dithiol-disulfide isomerase [Bacilli bacterium PM5-9]
MKIKLVIDFLAEESYELIKYLMEYQKNNEIDLELHGYDLNEKNEINKAYYGLYFASKYGVALAYVNEILKAKFEDMQDIGSLDVLANAYERIGFDRNDFIDAIMDGDYVEMFQYRQASLKKEETQNECFAYIYDTDKKIVIGKDDIIKEIENNK